MSKNDTGDLDKLSTTSSGKLRTARTAFLYAGYFAVGMAALIVSPTLQDLARNIGQTTKELSYTYIARSLGIIIGSLGGGALFDKYNRHPGMLVALFGAAVSTTLIPWCRNLAQLIITRGAGGVFLGAVDAGLNVWCLDLWSENSEPYLQGLHFFYGLGCIVAPFIAEPFLRPDPELLLSENSTTPVPTNRNETDLKYYSEYSYGIVGGYIFLVWIYLLALTLYDKTDERPDRTVTKENISKNDNKRFVVPVVVLATVHLSVYCGLESGYAQMLPTFAVKGDLQLSQTTGSNLLSCLYGTYCVVRFLSIFWTIKASNRAILITDQTVMLASCLVLLLLGSRFEWALWLGTALLGLGMASFLPGVFSWNEESVLITGKIIGFFTVATAIADMAATFVIGQFIDEQPGFIFIMCTILAGLMFAVFVVEVVFLQVWSSRERTFDAGLGGELQLGIPESKSIDRF